MCVWCKKQWKLKLKCQCVTRCASKSHAFYWSLNAEQRKRNKNGNDDNHTTMDYLLMLWLFANLYMYNFSIILWSVGCKCQIYGTIIQKRFTSLTIPLFCLVCFFLSVFGGTLTLCRNVVLFFYLFQYAIVCLCFCASSCICSQYTIHMYTNSKCA